MLHLKIQLIEAVCPASGLGEPGVVDRDVILNPAGIPRIPGRRLKGVLRDEYEQLCAGPLGAELPHPDELFGSSGQRTAAIRIGDARLIWPEAPEFDMEAWIASVLDLGDGPNNKLLWPDEITRQFTEIRRQTRIERETGAAKEDTLRFTRVLKADQVFSAQVAAHDDRHRNALAFAAAAVKVMGAGRSRGIGRVKCWIEENGAEVALDPKLRPVDPSRDLKPDQDLPNPIHLNPGVPQQGYTHALRYRLTLKTAAVLPGLFEGDPNTVITHHYVPGTAIHGVLAERALQSTPDRFYELFAAGRLAFLPANPAIQNGDQWTRLDPAPQSIRRTKDRDSKYLDWAQGLPGDIDEDERKTYSKRLKSGFFDWGPWRQGSRSVQAEIETNLQYHHLRATDKRLQRALSSEPDDLQPYQLKPGQSGTLFVYESLLPGQNFVGEILGSEADLQIIRGLIADQDTIRVGRSGSAQYGGEAAWEWISKNPEPAKVPFSAPQDGQLHIVRLLTPLIGLNPYGHPVPRFPVEDLGAGLDIIKSFARVEWVGGYLSHQRLPRRQMPAIAAGSVFIIEGTIQDLDAARRRSYGLRVEEGFGRVEIGAWRQFPKQAISTKGIKTHAKRHIDRVGPDHKPAWDLLRRIAIDRIQGKLREHAETQASASVGPSNPDGVPVIRPHLLYRLIQALEVPSDPLANLVKEIESTRRTASKQMDGFRIGRLSLKQYLSHFAQEPTPAKLTHVVTDLFDVSAWREIADSQRLEDELRADSQLIVSLTRAYLLRYLSALARTIKHERSKPNDSSTQ